MKNNSKVLASSEIYSNGTKISKKKCFIFYFLFFVLIEFLDSYSLDTSIEKVGLFLSYNPPNNNSQNTLKIESVYFEVDDPSIFFLTISKNEIFQTNSSSFLQFQDDFIDNTYSDEDVKSVDFNNLEKNFIDNSSPEYLNSVLNLDNGTLIQNGLVTKLNMILLNLLMNEEKNNGIENKTEDSFYNQSEKIQLLEKMLNSLNVVMMNLSNENNRLKNKIQDLTNSLSAKNATKETNISKNKNETKLKNKTVKANINASKIYLKNVSFYLFKNKIQEILVNFICLKSGSSKARLYFVPNHLYNPFPEVKKTTKL